MRREVFRKLTLTILLTLTAISFVHVNGKSLYIVDWRMVMVVGGGCPTPYKKEGELSGTEKCPGEYVREEYDEGKMSGSRSPSVWPSILEVSCCAAVVP